MHGYKFRPAVRASAIIAAMKRRPDGGRFCLQAWEVHYICDDLALRTANFIAVDVDKGILPGNFMAKR